MHWKNNNEDQVLQLQEEISEKQDKNKRQDLKPAVYEPQFKSIQSKKLLVYDEDDQLPVQKVLVQKKSELRIMNTKSIQRLKLNNFVQKKQQPQQDNQGKRNKKRKVKIDRPEEKQSQFNPEVLKKSINQNEEVKAFVKVERKDQDDDKNQNRQQEQSKSNLQSLSNITQEKDNLSLIKQKPSPSKSDLKMIPSSSSQKFLIKLNQEKFDANNVQKNTMFNQKQEGDEQYIIAKRKENLQLLQGLKKAQRQKKQLIKLAPLKGQQTVQVMKRVKKEETKEKIDKKQNTNELKQELDEEVQYEKQLKKLLKKEKGKTKILRYPKKTLKNFCLQTITIGRFIECKLKRDKSGMNMFFPQYNVCLDQGKDKYLVSAKKNIGSYSISVSNERFDQNSDSYLGYVEGNFSGSVYNVLYRRQQDNFEQKIATIVYDSDIVIGSQFRTIEIYMKNQNFLFNELDGVDVQSSSTQNLCDLYNQFLTNKTLGKIIKLITKSPIYDPVTKQFGLDFKGKISKGSVKNMIIINAQKPDEEVMVFGKTDEHDFYLKIHNPMSVLVAMGILMSSFDFKLASQ